ncbi:Neogenin (Fragment) [Geodia barretti]|uniref:Neogenin n=1 Tax=Geodia barretti TaxID=519541 RepID=A0AA35TAJ6_GEOBA
MMYYLLMLSLLWPLVEVHSQTFPHLSFMGQTLANHSYVDLGQVGRPDDGGEGVRCITDLTTCCTGSDGSHRGDWYFPNGTRLPIPASDVDTFEAREPQRVDIHRNTNAKSPTGIYRCDIPTNAVHDDDDISVRDTVYVGLYTASGGDVSISGGLTFDSDQGTLTCISTGGPATTVTWTRDSTTVTQGTQTVLNDPVTAQYTHTLTVRLGGLYSCTVSNNKPSVVSGTLTVRVASAPTNLMFEVQSDGTSVLLTWTPPDPLGDTTGYTISYTGGGSSGSETVSGGSTNSYTLTGLIREEMYDISIVGTSEHISGESVEWETATLVPGLTGGERKVDGPDLTVEVIMMGVSSISLSWRVSGDTVVDSEVVWRAISGPAGDRGVSGSITSTSYTIPDLQKLSVYSVTITVRTSSSGDFSESVIAFTVPACESSGSSSEAVAALGGVLAVVIVTAIAVQAMVIVFFVKKLQRAEEYTATLAARLKRAPPGSLKTTSNVAYSVVRGETDDAYETVMS